MYLVQILNIYIYIFFFFFFFFLTFFFFFFFFFFFKLLLLLFNTYVVKHCPATGMQNSDEASSSIILAY